jgi:glycosyltransferase involved in cell wall biosynthesis
MQTIALALLRGHPKGAPPRPRDPTGETAARGYLFDEMFARNYDESILDDAAPVPFRSLPPWTRLALEVHRRRDEYDAIVTWGERLTLSLMALQSLSRDRKPHIPLMYWFSKTNVSVPMHLFARSLHGIVTWSSVQRAHAIDKLRFPAERLHLVKHFVDQKFWAPRDHETDMICAAGKEMRDYPTLIEALRGVDVPCHIATDTVRVNNHGLFAHHIPAERFDAAGNPHLTIGPRSHAELRELYARSRFVVVPLLPSDTDNGVNVILEAMAMGKPVICSRTRGQVDVIQEGVTGIFVPLGDPLALRRAIVDLWRDPERARRMGAAARAYVEQHHTLDKFCRDVWQAIETMLR